MKHYFVVVASGVLIDQEDFISAVAFENGATGISEALNFQQLDSLYQVSTLESEAKTLNIYFEDKPSSLALENIFKNFQNVKFELNIEENKDWMAEWKKGFVSFDLAKGVRVIPSWESQSENNSDINIFVDPGMAFGTGTHSTTKIAAELLNGLNVHDKHVLDVGTGTGILAILAEKKIAAKVEATEIDPVAREVAKENCKFNNCSKVKVLDYQLDEISGSFDIVIANIIDGVLVRIQNDLKRLVKSGGYLLLTGILEEREDHFLSNFDRKDLKIEKKIQKEEWLGFLLKS